MSAASLELIAAVARNGVIGRNGQLPWHLPDDLKHFKQLTLGHPIIMGRRTYESIGKPLPGRRSIVVSSTLGKIKGIEVLPSLDEALGLFRDTPGPAFIIGGAVLYAATLPIVNVLHLTELDESVEGDAFFPPLDKSEWRLVSEHHHDRDTRHAIPFYFRTFERSK
jgi:dihydrofolate reductase